MTRMTSTEIDLLAQAGAIAKHSGLSEEAQLFQKALALIEDPRNWCQGDYEKSFRFALPLPLCHSFDDFSTEIMIQVEERKQYCTVGAIRATYFVTGVSYTAYMHVRYAIDAGMEGSAINYNDSHTHAQVIAQLKEIGRNNSWM